MKKELELQLAKVKDLIVANQAIKERTPFLDVALGGLKTSADNYAYAIANLPAEKAAPAKAEPAPVPAAPAKTN